MKQLGWIVAILVVVAAVLSLPFVTAHHAPARAPCGGRVLILKGAHGEPLECVCVDGTLSTCFNPGP